MKNVIKLYIIISSLFFVGCTLPSKVDVNKIEHKKPPLILNPIQPLVLERFKFNVINVDDEVYIALRPKEYERLSVNFIRLKNYIETQNAVIQTYKKFYEESEELK